MRKSDGAMPGRACATRNTVIVLMLLLLLLLLLLLMIIIMIITIIQMIIMIIIIVIIMITIIAIIQLITIMITQRLLAIFPRVPRRFPKGPAKGRAARPHDS